MEKSQAGAIVQLFQGAYPNTEFVDSVLSAATWYLVLKDYDFDETKKASIEIIKTEEKGYKVNIAAVLKKIHENRAIQRQKEENEKRIREQEEAKKNKVSHERMVEILKPLYEKYGWTLKLEDENK